MGRRRPAGGGVGQGMMSVARDGSPLGRDLTRALLQGRGANTNRPLIVVGSGKGGTGKTFLAANLAVQWSLWGRRVILVDADLGLANLHVVLGIEPPDNLSSLLAAGRRRNGEARELLVEGPAGVRLLAGGSGIDRLAGLNRGDLRRLVQRLEPCLSAGDAVIVDLSSGLSPATLLFLQAAHHVVIVSNPDPSALLDAYAVIKVLATAGHGGEIHMVLNRCSDPVTGMHAGQRVLETAERFLGRRVNVLGQVPEDEAVSAALGRRRPLLLDRPACPAAGGVRLLAQRLLAACAIRREGTVDAFMARSAELLAPRGARGSV